jgi:hypothetical protein
MISKSFYLDKTYGEIVAYYRVGSILVIESFFNCRLIDVYNKVARAEGFSSLLILEGREKVEHGKRIIPYEVYRYLRVEFEALKIAELHGV